MYKLCNSPLPALLQKPGDNSAARQGYAIYYIFPVHYLSGSLSRVAGMIDS